MYIYVHNYLIQKILKKKNFSERKNSHKEPFSMKNI